MERRSFFRAVGGALAALQSDAIERVRAAAKSVDGRSPDEIARDEDFWFRVRHAFTIDRNIINLNNGSVSPSPQVVQDAMRHYLDVTNMQPAYYVDEYLIPQIERVRSRLAAAFGCDPEEMAVTRNTSESLAIVQYGLDLKAGDEVLTTTQDYPSMLMNWGQRARRDGIVLKTIAFPVPPPSLDDLYERFERAITPRTKVILFCHMTYTTGQIFPVKRICRMARERGIQTIVDGGHTFAQFPFTRDDLACDYYGTSLHKWLTAPIGTGFLYVRRENIPRVWALMGSTQDMTNDIRKFEHIGTAPVANKNAITEALNFHESLGAERKAARLRYLRERWSRRVEKLPGVKILTSYDPEQGCALGGMSIASVDADKLVDFLMQKHRIHVRARHVPGEYSCIRVTPNVYTTLEEVDTFSAAIEEAARGV
ncbi:MAG: aminotransferase class V-fold PLP-dependent enzyme [Acidobacteria bacterium]|nr:aminotransferase class V-fold PLP-dependent enzyme [Acidobacteriota bacterium]